LAVDAPAEPAQPARVALPPQGRAGGEGPQRPSAGRGPGGGAPGGQARPRREGAPPASEAPKLRIIPLGGLQEIGKNCMVYEYGRDIIVVDCGLAFPDEEMPGIDVVIPDMTYLEENRERVRGVVLTHGHEDHIGSVSYLVRKMSVPIYGTRLTMGLVEYRLAEAGLKLPEHSRVVSPGDTVRLGSSFQVDFFRVNHSIPDACGVAITTPVGTVVHTGDFKFDHTPVDHSVADFHKLAQLGDKGVLVLLADSTNAERPGFTGSETSVGAALQDVIGKAEGRVFVGTFASNIHRVQQVVDAAVEHGRKVGVVGRSMENVVRTAIELGYLHVPEGTLIELDDIGRYAANRLCILTTGSQGEPLSALARMSTGEHRKVEIVPGDTVVFSANPIPGNEKAVSRVVDNLFKLGAHVVYSVRQGVHVSGHASQEELKLMLSLVRPKFFVPVHGEYRMLVTHTQLAQSLGVPKENTFIAENGLVLEFSQTSGQVAGRVTAGVVLVDGLGVGDVGNIVLRDRKVLAEDGVIVVVMALSRQNNQVVAGPDFVSRGFVYVRESDRLMDEAKRRVRDALAKCEERKVTDWSAIKQGVRDALGKFLYDRTRRRPMILPIILEV
jgi:ribonuclease J